MGVNFNIIKQFIGYNTLVVYSYSILWNYNSLEQAYSCGIYQLPRQFNQAYLCYHCHNIDFRQLWTKNYFALLFFCVYYQQLLDKFGTDFKHSWLHYAYDHHFDGQFGISYSTVESKYLNKIIQPEQAQNASLITWLALFIVKLILPILIEAMFDHNVWPSFAFFAVYCAVSTVYKWLRLVESKDMPYSDVLKDFE